MYRSKKFTKISIKVWLTLFRAWKQLLWTVKNSKASEPHRFRLDLTGNLNLKNPKKDMALTNLSIYYLWKNIKSKYNNNKFKTLAPTWNDSFDLPDGSYSISDIQDCFEFIIKKHETWNWKSTGSSLSKQNQIQICFQNKNRLQIRIVNSWNNEIVWKWKKTLAKTKMEKMYQN